MHHDGSTWHICDISLVLGGNKYCHYILIVSWWTTNIKPYFVAVDSIRIEKYCLVRTIGGTLKATDKNVIRFFITNYSKTDWFKTRLINF